MYNNVFSHIMACYIYDIIIKIVEPLRAGSDEGLKPVYEDLLNEKQKYSSLLKK